MHSHSQLQVVDKKDVISALPGVPEGFVGSQILDGVLNSGCCAGERIFDFFTPGEIGQHVVVFTFSMTFACFVVFFYMIGAYPLFMLQSDPSTADCMSAAGAPSGRHLFIDWMFPGVRKRLTAKH